MHPGFDSRNVLVARLYLSSSGYSLDQELRFDRSLRLRLESAPAVQQVGYADWVPLWFGNSPWNGVLVDGYSRDTRTIQMSPHARGARLFRSHEDSGALGPRFHRAGRRQSRPVMIVNQAFARRFYGGGDPVGRTARVNGYPCRIVGMVRDSKQITPAEAPYPFFYEPFAQSFGTGDNNFIYIRTAGDPDAARATLRHEIAALDGGTGLYDAMPLEEYTQASLYPQKVAAMLLAALGLLSLVLAALGLYSVMAYVVTERTHEIGIRMALGAQRTSVHAMVARKAINMTAAGLAVGIAVALAVAHLVGSLLVQVSPADPLTFLFAIVFLSGVALAASYVPAYRATRVDPMSALRCE